MRKGRSDMYRVKVTDAEWISKNIPGRTFPEKIRHLIKMVKDDNPILSELTKVEEEYINLISHLFTPEELRLFRFLFAMLRREVSSKIDRRSIRIYDEINSNRESLLRIIEEVYHP